MSACLRKRTATRGLMAALVAACLMLGMGCAPGSFSTGDPLYSGRANSGGLVGRLTTHRITGDETLLDLTRRYNLGYGELVAANPGVDAWVPGEGTEVVLPTAHLVPSGPREGIVVNLTEQRLYLFLGGLTDSESGGAAAGSGASVSDREAPDVLSFPIGVSREGWTTPIGSTRVKRKRASPAWYPTASARREDPSLPGMVAAGPENPLGTHALYLGWPRYLIHGTNEPDGVGRRVSRGCIRLYPEDIVRLFEATPLETPVRVIEEPIKLGRIGRDLYLEVHPSLADLAALEERGLAESPVAEADAKALRPRIRALAGTARERVDWSVVDRVLAERRGVPVRISF